MDRYVPLANRKTPITKNDDERFEADPFLDDWSINEECFKYIKETLPPGKTILELGSGRGTRLLLKHYNVISIEEDINWVNRYSKAQYIHAPIKYYTSPILKKISGCTGWYNPDIINEELNGKNKKEYDLILVDGPARSGGRIGFYEFLDLFDTTKPMIFDDIERPKDFEVLKMVSNKLNKPFKLLPDKKIGVII